MLSELQKYAYYSGYMNTSEIHKATPKPTPVNDPTGGGKEYAWYEDDPNAGWFDNTRKTVKNVASDPLKYIQNTSLGKKAIGAVEGRVKKGLMASTAANAAATLGTGMIGEMTANSRHNETMKMLKRMQSNQQRHKQQPRAMRLSSARKPNTGY